MRKPLVLLSLLAFLSLVAFSLFLYGKGSQNVAAVPLQHSVENLQKISFWDDGKTEEEEEEAPRSGAMKFSWKKTEANVTSKEAVMSEALEKPGGCPETPPGLVGPLLVEFSKRTLEEVRVKVGSPLQEGGRYKPPDCISQHKVKLFTP